MTITLQPTVTIQKYRPNGDLAVQYPATVREHSADFICVEARFNFDEYHADHVSLYRNDLFVEYFFPTRYHNIFAIYNATGDQFKGWYCDICRPITLTPTTISYIDLALDVWVTPSYDVRLLDENEFAALPLDDDERQRCREAVNHIKSMAEQKTLPR